MLYSTGFSVTIPVVGSRPPEKILRLCLRLKNTGVKDYTVLSPYGGLSVLSEFLS